MLYELLCVDGCDVGVVWFIKGLFLNEIIIKLGVVKILFLFFFVIFCIVGVWVMMWWIR